MRGIVIAVPQKYESICLINIQRLRQLHCSLPIEMWEIGQEISEDVRIEFSKIEGISFKNVTDYSDESKHWKGFQVKAFILKHTKFTEVLLCDADIIFYQNPEVLFNDEHYLDTGAYFFKDLDIWVFKQLGIIYQLLQIIKKNKFRSRSHFLARKRWLQSILPIKSALFPVEWDYIYNDDIPTRPVKEALQEAGVVLMDKQKHAESIHHIYRLNDAHEHTYKFIHGDKETYWMGCIMANKPFYFNESVGYLARDTGKLSHDYRGTLFFSQKG
jgi:alpha 1,3-mannosyltransferase